jgi:aconitate hydratase 2/2-methylisocitrate dehydratase
MLLYLEKNFKVLPVKLLNIELKSAFAPSKQVYNPGQGFTAVEKIFNANAVGVEDGINYMQVLMCE